MLILLGDSFAKIGLALMADGSLTGWDGAFATIYGSVIIDILILLFIADGEEKNIRQHKIKSKIVPLAL